MSTFTASTSRYGYPIAEFEPAPLTVANRVVIATAVIWDAEYNHFRAIGHYAKKDGTAGFQVAKPLMGRGEVPADMRAALEELV